MGAERSGSSTDLPVGKKGDLSVALLEVPNDLKLHQLILHGEAKNPEGRSGAEYKLAARLGELGIRPESIHAIIEFADKRWGKFSTRADWPERLADLLRVAESKRPISQYAGYRPVSLKQLKDQTPEVDWVIPGLLARATYMLITGGTGVGKSQFALQIGMGLAKGAEYNDYILERSRVLYGSHEMTANELIYFTDKLQLACPLADEDVFDVIPIGHTVSLLTQEGRDFYLQYLDDYDIFMFDTVSSSTHLAMLDEQSAPGIVEFFNILTREGKTIIALGHDTKDAIRNKNARAEDMYGARYLMDRSSAIIRLEAEPDDDEHITISFPKLRLGRAPKPTIWERSTETLWLTRTSDTAQAIRALKKAGIKPTPEIVIEDTTGLFG